MSLTLVGDIALGIGVLVVVIMAWRSLRKKSFENFAIPVRDVQTKEREEELERRLNKLEAEILEQSLYEQSGGEHNQKSRADT